MRDELNVHELRFVADADELGEVQIKANYRTLGPRFGKDMPIVAAAVAGLNPTTAARTLRDGGVVGIEVGGQDHSLTAEDLLITMKPLEGYLVEREGSHAVALELEITDELRPGFETGALKPPTIEIVPFEQAVDAYSRMAARQVKAKQVLSFG